MEEYANLSNEELKKIIQLEEELGVVLLAYKDDDDNTGETTR